MLTTKNETSNAWPTRAVRATATTIDSSPSSTGTRPATTAPNTSTRMISAAGSPISSSPFLQVFPGELLEVGVGGQGAGDRDLEPGIAVLRGDQFDERGDVVAAR